MRTRKHRGRDDPRFRSETIGKDIAEDESSFVAVTVARRRIEMPKRHAIFLKRFQYLFLIIFADFVRSFKLFFQFLFTIFYQFFRYHFSLLTSMSDIYIMSDIVIIILKLPPP